MKKSSSPSVPAVISPLPAPAIIQEAMGPPTPIPGRTRPTDIAPDESEADRKSLQKLHNGAEQFMELSAGMYLHRLNQSVFEGQQFSGPVVQAYRDRLLHDAGNPSDPVEQMLIEQLMFLHHAIGRLHLRASAATTAETAKAYYGAAARLTGELRRLALTLRTYRSPVEPTRFTVVKQQNLAQSQQIALVDHSGSLEKDSSGSTQLVSNCSEVLEHVAPASITTQSPPSRSRQTKPRQTGTADS